MNLLTDEQISEVSGGDLATILGAIGAAAVVYKTAYETATWFGAGAVGEWLGSGWYTANEICGAGVMAKYG